MAYATSAAYVPTGVMGIGFDTNEAITDEGGKPCQNFIDVLVSQNVTSTKAYSLWLNDLGKCNQSPQENAVVPVILTYSRCQHG